MTTVSSAFLTAGIYVLIGLALGVHFFWASALKDQESPSSHHLPVYAVRFMLFWPFIVIAMASMLAWNNFLHRNVNDVAALEGRYDHGASRRRRRIRRAP